MKRTLSVLLVLVMVFSMFGTAFAASSNTLTYHLTSDEEYYRIVPAGSTVEVAFAIENDANAAITLRSIQNEIYFDHTFFEFVEGSATVVKRSAGISCDLQVYSDQEHRVYVNTIDKADYAEKELIATFTYDNYDAIEVPYTDAIPADYNGIMGVPISFLDKYCPEQFEILGITDRNAQYGYRTKVYTLTDAKNFNDLNRGPAIKSGDTYKVVYTRIFIRKKVSE